MLILYASISILFIAGVILIYLTISSQRKVLKEIHENDRKLIDFVFKAGEGYLKEATASKRVKEVVELRDLLVENNIIEHGALRIAVECVYGLKEDFYRHNKAIDISMIQRAEDVCWDAAHDEKIKQEVSELLQSKGEPVFQENVPKDQPL
ncbi:hypothetical protein [uncultured Desulfovibrio sp.]|jgi:hypothetical protein|uniref:hypothetical protein n=1 Tax=uncultured Desulfovibrio sp. TaxID=167968 RepID=UPI002803A1CE|nr:hypothetical protein [uncultured Desulfovibrio sp.]